MPPTNGFIIAAPGQARRRPARSRRPGRGAAAAFDDRQRDQAERIGHRMLRHPPEAALQAVDAQSVRRPPVGKRVDVQIAHLAERHAALPESPEREGPFGARRDDRQRRRRPPPATRGAARSRRSRKIADTNSSAVPSALTFRQRLDVSVSGAGAVPRAPPAAGSRSSSSESAGARDTDCAAATRTSRSPRSAPCATRSRR